MLGYSSSNWLQQAGNLLAQYGLLASLASACGVNYRAFDALTEISDRALVGLAELIRRTLGALAELSFRALDAPVISYRALDTLTGSTFRAVNALAQIIFRALDALAELFGISPQEQAILKGPQFRTRLSEQ